MSPNPQSSRRRSPRPPRKADGVKLNDFVAYMPAHNYIFTPCREPWPASSCKCSSRRDPVLTKWKTETRQDGKPITMGPSTWLDKNRPVEQMTWCPGLPMLIKDRLVVHRRLDQAQGCHLLQPLPPAAIVLGDAAKADPWINHVRKSTRRRRRSHHHVARPSRAAAGRRLTTPSCWAEGRELARIACSRRSIMPIGHGIFTIEPRPICWAGLTILPRPVILRVDEARDLGDATGSNSTTTPRSTPPPRRKCCAWTRSTCANTTCSTSSASSSRPTTRPTASICQRTIAGISWPGPTHQEKNSRRTIGTSCGLVSSRRLRTRRGLSRRARLSDFDPKAPPPKTPAFWDIVDANTAHRKTLSSWT